MKNIFMSLIILTVVILGSEIPVAADESLDFEFVFGDTIDNENDTQQQGRSVTAPVGLKMSFRSSAIEFWSTGHHMEPLNRDNGEYFFNLYSSFADRNVDAVFKDRISDEVAASGIPSVYLELSDTEGNMFFMPDKVTMGQVDTPDFDLNKVYDIVRIDLGSGTMEYSINGTHINPVGVTVLDANSLLLVDNPGLTDAHHLTSREMLEMVEYAGETPYLDISTWDSLGDDVLFIYNFVRYNSAYYNHQLTSPDPDAGEWDVVSEYWMDMTGALIIPFNAIDFTGISGNNFQVRVEWDMDSVFESTDGGVFVLNRDVDGTPYDFNVLVR